MSPAVDSTMPKLAVEQVARVIDSPQAIGPFNPNRRT
jgi:hypothetical protein